MTTSTKHPTATKIDARHLAAAFAGLAKPAAEVAKALRQLGKNAAWAIECFAGFPSAVNTPGDWPDSYTLLNRFMRTGYVPRWLKQMYMDEL